MGKRWTDRYVKSLEPKATRYDVREGDGLGIRVSPDGTKHWFFMWAREGRKRRQHLGAYPQISVADAHKEHGRILNDLEHGRDPFADRDARRTSPTVGRLIDLYLKEWAEPRKRSWKTDERILRKELKPWTHRKAADIRRADVKDVLAEIVARGSPGMANVTAAVVRKLFAWAVQEEILEASPAYMVQNPAPRKPRQRVLTDREIRGFWTGLDRTKVSDSAQRALRVVLLTGQRPGEVAGMRWEEIEDELTGVWWTIPEERSKNGQAHRVPLSGAVLDILGTWGEEGPVFPSPFPGRTASPLHEDALGQAVRGILPQLKIAKFTPHDLRRTCATRIAEAGASRVVLDRILNHRERGVTARHYDRYEYAAEKRAALDAWAEHLRQIVKGKPARVVPLRKAGG